MDPTTRFAELVAGPEAALPLDEAGMLIAAHAHPGLDVEAQVARFDALAARVPEPDLAGIRRLLFDELGFTGNVADYYDPGNSYLDDVLDRRTGIPITLAIVLIETARRVGVALVGISMPGHFLVADPVDAEVFVDPFRQGASLDRRGCRQRFAEVHGPEVRFEERFLEPAGRRSIVERQLANLETIARARGELFTLLWVLRLRAALPGTDPATLRRYASALGAAGQPGQAAVVFEQLAASAPDDRTGDEATHAARAMRARLN